MYRTGTWEVSGVAVNGAGAGRAASGRRGAVADDARTREVGPSHSSDEAGEQSGRTICGASCRGKARGGVGGAKGRDEGECGPAKHAPDAAPAPRGTGAGTHTESGAHPLCRHTPEVGAGCGKAARPDLCGGREGTRVPTATSAARLHRYARRRGGVAARGARATATNAGDRLSQFQ